MDNWKDLNKIEHGRALFEEVKMLLVDSSIDLRKIFILVWKRSNNIAYP